MLSDSSVLFSMTSISGENNHGHHYNSVWLVSAMSVFSLFICFVFFPLLPPPWTVLSLQSIYSRRSVRTR